MPPTPTEAFAADPLGYLATNIVNPAFGETFRRVFAPEPGTFTGNFGALLDSGAFPIQEFQIVPLMIHTSVNHGILPVPETYFTGTFSYQQSYPFTVLRNYGIRAKCLEAQNALIEFCSKKAPTLKWRPATGTTLPAYYFAYKAGGASKAEDMGYVDIPRADPACSFAFTGQMNGCHMVVTDSPVEGHFRVWHYQSPGSHPTFNRDNFPSRPVYEWLTDADYAGVVRNDEVAGFNFLWHDGSDWYLVSQPHKAVMATTLEQKALWNWGTYIAAPSTKALFRRKLSFE